ncbi:MAG: STAS/SEC14 domain-containing protein [Flavobacteriales bacterium]|nr:STAS/SEC14 domain-containing protein [Flavobacteriales bacterium]
MIKQTSTLRKDTLVVELSGYLIQKEIASLEPEMKAIEKEFGYVNLLVSLLNVKGESLGALMEELRLGLKHWNQIHKVAYIGDKDWLKALVKLDNVFVKFKEKYFDVPEMNEAWDWLGEEDKGGNAG